MEFGLIILAGGKSRRMGTDKALLPWKGHTLFEEVIAQTATLPFAQRIMVTDRPEAYPWGDFEQIADVVAGLGALGGLYSGLLYSHCQYNLVLPCDLPFLQPALLRQILAEVEQGCEAVVPFVGGRYQPLTAVYSKACLPAIAQLLFQEGQKKIMSFFDRVALKTVAIPATQAACFWNVNTPKQLAEAHRMAQTVQKEPLIVSIVANGSGTGKTTLIEQLIPCLKRRGISVAVLKSDSHGFVMDQPGKDTWRFTEAGADAVAIVGPNQYAVIQQTVQREPLAHVMAMFRNADVILVETRTQGTGLILEVVRAGVTTALTTPLTQLSAIITDLQDPPKALYCLPLQAPEATADFIMENYHAR